MKTPEEYQEMLKYTIDRVEKYFPNWKLVQTKEGFASMFARCMPTELTYEDIAVLCFLFHANSNRASREIIVT